MNTNISELLKGIIIFLNRKSNISKIENISNIKRVNHMNSYSIFIFIHKKKYSIFIFISYIHQATVFFIINWDVVVFKNYKYIFIKKKLKIYIKRVQTIHIRLNFSIKLSHQWLKFKIHLIISY